MLRLRICIFANFSWNLRVVRFISCFFLPLTPHGIERISATFRLSLTRHVCLYNEIHGLRLLLTSCKPIKEDHLVLRYELRQSYHEIRTQMTSNQNVFSADTPTWCFQEKVLNLAYISFALRRGHTLSITQKKKRC